MTEERWLTRMSTYVSETYKGPLKIEVIVVDEGVGSAEALRKLTPKLHGSTVKGSPQVPPPGRLPCLRRAHLARLAALGSRSPLPGRGPATWRPATASGARASRLQSRHFHRL